MAKFAERISFMELTSDVIRYLFESMTDPDTISFGGGAPAKEALPVETVHEIASRVLTREQEASRLFNTAIPSGFQICDRQSLTDSWYPRVLRPAWKTSLFCLVALRP